MHMFDLPGLQEDNAVTMVVNAFKWRKENNVRGVCILNKACLKLCP